ncbi:MAG: Crp/Fnr family transcriptional regulator [Bacteroidales bacterium]|nr:Crp/Fnr family transcriptional regulator [Bacteroidales bacterium]
MYFLEQNEPQASNLIHSPNQCNCDKKQCPLHVLFGNLSEQTCKSFQILANDQLFMQDLDIDRIYFVKSGLVKTYRREKSKVQLINLYNKKFIDLYFMLGQTKFPYYAQALTNSEICFINKKVFIEELIGSTIRLDKFLKIAATESELNQNLLFYNKGINGKIAYYLLFLAEQVFNNLCFNLPFTKTEFASFLGCSREYMCKKLTELHEDAVIMMRGNSVQITNRENLWNIYKFG